MNGTDPVTSARAVIDPTAKVERMGSRMGKLEAEAELNYQKKEGLEA